MSELKTDVLIVGGGVGGCAAAMAAASMGYNVILTEETDWLGGQLTSQAVPPDDHRWIDRYACTLRYKQFRHNVRQYYQQHYPFTSQARIDPLLNPGLGGVSKLCCEPRVALAAIEQMLAPYRSIGRLRALLQYKAIGAETIGDCVRVVVLESLVSGQRVTIEAPYILDATELGDLLPLAKVEYVVGAESQDDTGEPHAVSGPSQPDNVQAITWCFPVAYDPTEGTDYTISKPKQYDRWQDYVPEVTPPWGGKLLSWTASHPRTSKSRNYAFMPDETDPEMFSLWLYRRLVCRDHYMPEFLPHEVTLVNWPQNDYMDGNIIDKPENQVARYLEEARQLSLSLFYWMQTEAPRPDGGCGYPNLYLPPDIVGTDDGLAKFPYIRESRRIKAIFTVTENHVGTEARTPFGQTVSPENDIRAELFHDSIGVGSYRIDLHPSTGGNNYIDIASLPFQIPLGSLIPIRVENLLPACKNLGVTHITNGCYRMHPVEWNIGESAGLLAAFCLQRDVRPRIVRDKSELLADFQKLLINHGVELAWPKWHSM